METHRLALPSGFRLANYELTRVLGKGGFGITYLGEDRHLGRRVAVKELLPDTIVTRIKEGHVAPQSEELASNWEWAKERFMEEARVLASFKHPNIVEVHQLIEANGTVYMVMDYIEGESYEARLRRIGREADEHSMRLILEPLLAGLEEVHAAGLLHRDIKPDNILLRRGIQPILLDFGSARKLLEGTTPMTSLVTHGYSPIEQYQVKGKQGPWTDIYALGAVAARAITGDKPPMSADRMSEDDFVWLSYRGLEGFRPLFMQAIDWALRVKPKDRPQNISEWQASFGWTPRVSFPVRRPVPVSRAKAALGAQPGAQPSPATSGAPSTARPGTAPPNTSRAPTVTMPELRILKTVRKFPFIVPVLLFLAASGLLTVVGGTLALLTRPNEPAPLQTAEPISAPAPRAPEKPAPARNPVVFENSLGMKFVPVPGTGLLFSIWDTRVQDYRAFVQATGRGWTKPSFAQEVNHPAVNVSWEDANAFCRWLSTKENREYRLPTDAEWSLAAGLPPENGSTPKDKDGNMKRNYPWGDFWPPPKGAGNYNRALSADDYEKTSPVGVFPANRYGLFDLSGNVWQWCEDWYDTFQRRRVLRGGAWNSCTQDILLSSFRYYSFPTDQYDNIGFRCVTVEKKAGPR
ncbi:MAG: SUMF1/EgtB/PvdO family nonheme iron enzyme [Verrucomicrobia bacterium]|nr:SUMF1/EgtB/PvdO family nonheme iron enzyme [Verrucomicrobiota bacterium]